MRNFFFIGLLCVSPALYALGDSFNAENCSFNAGDINAPVTLTCSNLDPEIQKSLNEFLKKAQETQVESQRSQKNLNDALDSKESKLEQLQKEAEDWINRYKSLSKDLESLRRENPDYAEILTKAEAFLKQGKFSEVTALLEPLKAKGDEKTQQNAKIHFILGQAYLLDNKPVQALPEYEAAYHQDFKNIRYGFEYAELLRKQNEYKKAQRLYESLLDELKQLSKPEQQEKQDILLAVMNNLTLICANTQKREKAEKRSCKALKLYRNLAQSDPHFLPYVAIILHNLANLVADDPARREEAEQGYREALKIRRDLAQSNPQIFLPEFAMTLQNLANLIAKDPKRREEAEQDFREALKILRELAQTNPQDFLPEVAVMLSNIAILIGSDPTRREESEQDFREALKIRRELAQTNPQDFLPDVATTLNNLALLAALNPKHGEEAEQGCREALKIRRDLVKINPNVYLPELADVLNNLGYTLQKNPVHRVEAEQLLQESLAIYRELVKTNADVYRPLLPFVLDSLAITLAYDASRQQETEALYQEAIQIIRELITANNKYLLTFIRVLRNFATFHLRYERAEEALKLITEAVESGEGLIKTEPHFANEQAKNLIVLGQIQLKQDKTQLACSTWKTALEKAKVEQVDEVKTLINQHCL